MVQPGISRQFFGRTIDYPVDVHDPVVLFAASVNPRQRIDIICPAKRPPVGDIRLVYVPGQKVQRQNVQTIVLQHLREQPGRLAVQPLKINRRNQVTGDVVLAIRSENLPFDIGQRAVSEAATEQAPGRMQQVQVIGRVKSAIDTVNDHTVPYQRNIERRTVVTDQRPVVGAFSQDRFKQGRLIGIVRQDILTDLKPACGEAAQPDQKRNSAGASETGRLRIEKKQVGQPVLTVTLFDQKSRIQQR